MITIACVLRSGGDYYPKHVHALRDGVARNLTLPHRFVCLTDMDVDCESLPLRHGWSGWFSKLELFDGRLTGPVFYSDLDVKIVGSLNEIVRGHRFTVLQSFWADKYKEPERIGSGLMAWDCDLSSIYETFRRDDNRFLVEYKTKAKWGDQAFIKDHAPIEPERWQMKYPGKVVSFKRHVAPNRGVPAVASVCCFHGPPRPWSLAPFQRAWFDRVREAA